MTAIAGKHRDEVAAAVRSLLGEQRRTVNDLGGALHLNRTTVSSRINGGSSFTADELERVAVFFNLADVYALMDIAESISKRNSGLAAAS